MSESVLQKPEDFFCSHSSLEIDESILGSAPKVHHFYLLEHPGPYGSKALKESDISDPVKDFLNAHLNEKPFSKLLMIKNQETKSSNSKTFYYINTSEETPLVYKTTFSEYEELIPLDLNDLDAKETSERFMLICTNGKRDKCCAKYGLPMYLEISKSGNIPIWECSHLGQHRFTPNVLAFPYGIYYGRSNQIDSATFVSDILEDRINLHNLRGRTRYTKVEQAAEGILLEKLGLSSIHDLHLTRTEELDKDHWQFVFEHNGKNHMFEIHIEKGETKIFASCVGEKTTQAVTYKLDAYKG